MCLVGGVALQLVNGCFFLWANISTYVLSYMYQKGGDMDLNAIFYVDLALLLLNCTGYQVGTYLLRNRKWNPKLIILTGGGTAMVGILVASFTTRLGPFLFFYACMSGIGCGMNYFIPLVCAWEHFPQRKGLCTGIIVGAYGIGSFIFTRVSTRIVNPNDLQATISINQDLTLFGPEVADRVPLMLQTLVAVWTCLITISIVLISKAKDPEASNNYVAQEDQTEDLQESQRNLNDSDKPLSSSTEHVLTGSNKVDPDTREILRSYQLVSVKASFQSARFFQYFFMLYLGNIFVSVFSYLYKPIGLSVKYPDSLLAWAGSLGAIVQGVTRLTVGYLYDKVGFKKIYYTLMTVNTVLALFCYSTRYHRVVYFLCIQLNYFIVAGVFALFPTAVYNTFGTEKAPQIYSIILFSSFFASLTDTIIINLLYPLIGAQYTFVIGGVASFIGLFLCYVFEERLDIEKMDSKGLVVWGKTLVKT